MEKRIGTVTLLIGDRSQAPRINAAIAEFSDIVLCRQGLPRREEPVAVIALIVEGTSDRINSLTGQLGRIPGLTAKAVIK